MSVTPLEKQFGDLQHGGAEQQNHEGEQDEQEHGDARCGTATGQKE
jgi:hypothetical protein